MVESGFGAFPGIGIEADSPEPRAKASAEMGFSICGEDYERIARRCASVWVWRGAQRMPRIKGGKEWMSAEWIRRDERCEVQDARYKMQGARWKVQGARCKVQDARCRVRGAECEVLGAEDGERTFIFRRCFWRLVGGILVRRRAVRAVSSGSGAGPFGTCAARAAAEAAVCRMDFSREGTRLRAVPEGAGAGRTGGRVGAAADREGHRVGRCGSIKGRERRTAEAPAGTGLVG